MGKTVKVKSIGLLEELERKGMLYFLRKVEKNEKGVPVYCFSGTKKVYKIIREYNTKHNDELPEITPWSRYYKLIEFNATDMISTRNRTLVKRFFRAGYACCLIKFYRSPSKNALMSTSNIFASPTNSLTLIFILFVSSLA